MEFLKKNILISNIGGPGLGELSSLTAPQEPEELNGYSRTDGKDSGDVADNNGAELQPGKGG